MQITQGDDAPQMQVEERAIVRHWSKDNGERQIQPPLTGPNVLMSPAHFWLGFSTMKFCSSKFGAMLKGKRCVRTAGISA